MQLSQEPSLNPPMLGQLTHSACSVAKMLLLFLAAVLLDVDELIHELYSTGRRHVRTLESEKSAWDLRVPLLYI